MNPEMLNSLLKQNGIKGCLVLLHQVEPEKITAMLSVNDAEDMTIVKGLAQTIEKVLEERDAALPVAIRFQAAAIQALCDISFDL